MEKIVTIDGKQVKFKSTAGTLMRYRNNFQRDMLKDIVALEGKLKKVKSGAEQFQAVDLDLFEKLAWAMAKTADDTILPIENWLDNFETFSIMKVLPELIDLITGNMQTGAVKNAQTLATEEAK